jgi:hypothetical protein
MAARQDLKWLLVQQLYRRFQDAADVRHWYRYLDWFLVLPPQDAKDFQARITRFEEEKNVPFITSAEQIGMEKGIEKTLRAFLRLKFGTEGETLLAGRELTLTEEFATTLMEKLLPARTLEDARVALVTK